MAIQPGTRLGPYEILVAIGAGGMGEVYKARDTRLDRIVAIKVLPAHLADSSELRERFEREARTITSLSHPHICPLYDIGNQDGTDFLVMEYLEGETLGTRLLKGPLPLDQVLRHALMAPKRSGNLPWFASLAAIVLFAMAGRAQQAGRFVPSADGLTVHDNVLHVTWAADLNLPASHKFGLTVHDSGAMPYAVVRRWLAALNASGYGGRRNWTVPAMPTTDTSCSITRGPNGNSFGFNCVNNPIGSLYYRGLGLRQPNTAVPISSGRVGPFRNFQPYLYWSLNGKERTDGGRVAQRRAARQNGDHAFSFNTGWQGANVSDHVMYVLPMIPGPLPDTPPVAGTALQPSPDGQTVYDPIANVTWLANANLAAEMRFGVKGIAADGAMNRVTADAFMQAMNAYNRRGYLNHNTWQLPPTVVDPACSLPDGGYNCSGSPMGGLYYHHLLKILNVQPGEPVVRAPEIQLGPFRNLQPYLYWACAGKTNAISCSGGPAAPGFQFSFSFGNGFQGTEAVGNTLYVMVYAPDEH